nr:16S rRNA (uracil(1498)-N(3))-methyltransferase [uncultured Psychrobacter sp.]
MNCILLPAANITLPTAIIDDAKQIEHIDKVLGLKVGDSLKIGQLGGNIGSAIIEHITPLQIGLCDVTLTVEPPPKLNISVVLALPRPKVLRRLIMDMTALGVRDIILVNSYRTQKSYWQSPMLNRLDEFVLEGLQQGVDTTAPSITLEKRFKPFVEDKLADLVTTGAIVAHPYSEVSLTQYMQTLGNETRSTPLPCVVCIGNEGGWIDYEIDLLAKQGCQAVSMGSRILRTEAAVNVILGQWLLSQNYP